MSDYTTTEQIRNGFAAAAYTDAGVDRRLESFDRWLVAHDARVLRDAADRAFADKRTLQGLSRVVIGNWLRAEADRMAAVPADTTGDHE